ncbi:MAG: CPBP family glutamic-type intramembrane protease [Acidimicrobiales bacterium]
MTTTIIEPTTTPPIPAASLRRIAVYVVAVLGLGWLGPLVDRLVEQDDGAGPGQLLWLLLPIGAATLLRWRTPDGFADAGLRPRYRQNRRRYDLSSGFYPIAMIMAAAGGIAANHWELYDDSAPLRFAVLAAVGLIPFTFAAIAEEFGWRGYLTPRLQAAGVGRLANHVIVGVIWGAWHLPYMTTFWDFSDESLWTLAPRVILGTTVMAVVYGEIRLRTGSVWPAVIMHASSNAVAAALLNDQVLVQTEPIPWVFSPGVDGLVVTAISAGLGAFLVTRPLNATSSTPRIN